MISQEVADAVRADRQANGTSYRKLAEQHGINRASVGVIIRNQNVHRLGSTKLPSGIRFWKVPVYKCLGCDGARVDTLPCPACCARRKKHTSG